MRFTDKTVLVTGGAAGIGREIAARCASEGAHVCIGDIDESSGRETADELRAEAPEKVEFRRLDVTDSATFEACVDDLVARTGGINALFNNAASLVKAPFEETTHEELERLYRINVEGVWNGCQAVTPHMREAGGGAIVNTSSIRVIRGGALITAYSLTKGAIVNFTRSLAAELGPDDIRVNALCPGSVAHRMRDADDFDEKTVDERLAETPLGRMGDPEEMAAAAAFLGSEDASFITGHMLVVDGGRTVT